MGSSGRFGVCILAKATVETLLRPLFGQFLEGFFSETRLPPYDVLGNPEGKRHKKGAAVLRPQPQIIMAHSVVSLVSISHHRHRRHRRRRRYRGFVLSDCRYGFPPY